MFATASRSRRNTLTNVVVRQSMRPWSGNSSPITVQVFDIFSVIQAQGRSWSGEPVCRLAKANAAKTSQDVCSYYDVRLVVRFNW